MKSLLKSVAAPIALLLSAGVGYTAMADGDYPDNPYQPLIEVGGGGETQGQGAVNVLLNVRVGAKKTVEEGDPDDVLIISEQQIIAHMDGDISFNVSGNGKTIVPYMDIRFAGFEDVVTVGNSEDNLMLRGAIRIGDLKIGRNVALDQALVIQVSVVGVNVNKDLVRWDDVTFLGNVTLFAQLAADAIGYKMANHILDSNGVFHGFHLLGAGIGGGFNFEMSDNFNVRIELGGSADVNFGANTQLGFAIQSDMGAYAAVKFTIAKFVELFVLGRYAAVCEAWGASCSNAAQLMFGATFLF